MKNSIFLEILGAPRRKQFIASFIENPLYNIFKMQSVLILIVLF